MQSRKLTIGDIDKLAEWWASWGWESTPPLDFLSTDGIMIHDGDLDICAGFLYTISNASVAWFTFPVSNPDVRGKMRKQAIRMMIVEIEDMAKDMGYTYLYSSLRNSSMIQAQKNCGFIEADTNHTELLKII